MIQGNYATELVAFYTRKRRQNNFASEDTCNKELRIMEQKQQLEQERPRKQQQTTRKISKLHHPLKKELSRYRRCNLKVTISLCMKNIFVKILIVYPQLIVLP
mmetsp:Transcript_293/g.428  ORF Transcript_293/g.428 Transcript_293/m.428 type:complete len:103 (-) Transcript_293:1476-1784(-)